MLAEWLRRGALAGLAAGLAAVAVMDLAAVLVGTRSLPDLLQQPILAILPLRAPDAEGSTDPSRKGAQHEGKRSPGARRAGRGDPVAE